MDKIESFQASGSIMLIKPTDVKSERFSVREFVVDMPGDMGIQHVMFQMINQRCELLDAFEVGDEVSLDFKLQGREFTGRDGNVRYYNSLNVQSMQRRSAAPTLADPALSPAPTSSAPAPTSPEDDVPF